MTTTVFPRPPMWILGAALFVALIAALVNAQGQVLRSGGTYPSGPVTIEPQGDSQTPVTTPQATWAATEMGTDPWDNAAAPTAAGNAFQPFAPNRSVL